MYTLCIVHIAISFKNFSDFAMNCKRTDEIY